MARHSKSGEPLRETDRNNRAELRLAERTRKQVKGSEVNPRVQQPGINATIKDRISHVYPRANRRSPRQARQREDAGGLRAGAQGARRRTVRLLLGRRPFRILRAEP